MAKEHLDIVQFKHFSCGLKFLDLTGIQIKDACCVDKVNVCKLECKIVKKKSPRYFH